MTLPVSGAGCASRPSRSPGFWRTATRARRRFGGYVVHLGVVLVFVAIAASQSYVSHTTATLKPGERFQLGPYTVQMSGLRTVWIPSALDRGRRPGDRRQRPASTSSRRG